MEGFCRNFPEYTDQMKVFIQRETGDASLCRTALSVLESLVTLLQQLMDGKTDLRQLIEATLVDGDGRPRTEHGQRPSELLVELPKMAIWCCTIKVDIENSKGQYIEKDKQEATKDGSESTKIQHGI